MQWSKTSQHFRIAITGYPIKITGEIGETLDDYKRKHCGFSDQEAAGMRDVRNKFHLKVNEDIVFKIIYKQRNGYVREDKGKEISLNEVPSYVLYNLVNRLKKVSCYHWNKITKANLKQLSLLIFSI